ncbi:hypothetical protein CRI94_12705 [Longibacter salinarum]|uniref:Enterobactin synthase component D n=1 Tax=Longibacter salinarum TaxID=1850348 RepID=A0A2A8CWU4_9BACT|nr:4'-phosphopantetheinyl transferase superfamily protein [Longibacter salinarum]PEN12858.1 hypothetical protein CRI94_12705 [Longibacter salinarum]
MTEPHPGRKEPMTGAWLRAEQRLRSVLGDDVQLQAVAYDDDRAATWRTWLSVEERSCLETFGAEKRQREFIAGRAAARDLIGKEEEIDPADVRLKVADDGAVDVPDLMWHLSIAHCGPHAVAALSPTPVGTDLEAIAERDAGLERFLMHPEDERLLATLPYEHDASLILVWTIKESVLKARRSGFRTSPKKLNIDVGVHSGDVVEGMSVEKENAPPMTGQAFVTVDDGGVWKVAYTRVDPDEGEKDTYWWSVAIPE